MCLGSWEVPVLWFWSSHGICWQKQKFKAHPFSLHPHHPGCRFSTDWNLQAKFISCHNCHCVVWEVQAVQVHPWWVCRKWSHQYHSKNYIKVFFQHDVNPVKHRLFTNDVKFAREALWVSLRYKSIISCIVKGACFSFKTMDPTKQNDVSICLNWFWLNRI